MQSNVNVEVVGVFEPDTERRTEMSQSGSAFEGVRWFDSEDEMLGDDSIVAIASGSATPMTGSCASRIRSSTACAIGSKSTAPTRSSCSLPRRLIYAYTFSTKVPFVPDVPASLTDSKECAIINN